ncbi:MAG TPA: hypothetical protein VMC03_03055 [Streptosporangiaceae bacterium]|nr:hypothetical protein [Streptosporangiaceae bacterium]
MPAGKELWWTEEPGAVQVVVEQVTPDPVGPGGVAGIADRHLLVGDPGQLDPFTTMPDGDRWQGLAEDPTQTAVAVVRTNHPAVPVFQLPITRRLPPSAIPVVSAFYPDHPFAAWTLPGARSLTLMPAVRLRHHGHRRGPGRGGSLRMGVRPAPSRRC